MCLDFERVFMYIRPRENPHSYMYLWPFLLICAEVCRAVTTQPQAVPALHIHLPLSHQHQFKYYIII